MKNLVEMDAQEELRSGLEELVAAMVDHRADVVVEAGGGTAEWPVLAVVCRRADVGVVLGKEGATLGHLRLLALLAAKRLGFAGVSVDFDESKCQGPFQAGPRPAFVPRADWDREGFEGLATRVVAACLGRCAVALEPGKTRYKLTVAALEQLPPQHELKTKEPPVKAVEAALRRVLCCAGAQAGQLVTVELSDES